MGFDRLQRESALAFPIDLATRRAIKAEIERHLDAAHALIAFLDSCDGDTDLEGDPCDGPIDDDDRDSGAPFSTEHQLLGAGSGYLAP